MRSLFLAILALIMSNAYAEPFFPLPDGAHDIHHIDNSNGLHQDSFQIKLPYPSKVVINHYRSIFKNWQECSNSQGWHRFSDVSNGKNEFVHQFMYAWTSSDNQVLVVVGLRYISAGNKWLEKPTSKQQHVMLLINRGLTDASNEAKNMGFNCAPNNSLQPTSSLTRLLG
jgi:hypothetical protein